MAHLTYLRIDGLLGRESPVEFNLRRDVNIFFGENGSGKTTLLKVIDAAMNIDAAAVARLPLTRAEVHMYSIHEDREIKYVWDRKRQKETEQNIRLQLELLEKDFHSTSERLRFLKMREGTNPWKRTPPERPGDRTTRWNHTFLPTTRLYIGESVSTQIAASNKLSEDQLDALFTEAVNRAWLVYNSRVLGEVSTIQQEGLRAVLYSVLTPNKTSTSEPVSDLEDTYVRVRKFLERQAASGPSMLGTLEHFQNRYAKEDELRRVVANLDRVERRVEKAMAPTELFANTLQRLFSNGKKVSATGNQLSITLGNGYVLPPGALSSGEKHLLKLLLAALTADEHTVLVDEPELSMHIDWQRSFVETVKALNPNCQLILATHSPEIMAEISDDNIFKL